MSVSNARKVKQVEIEKLSAEERESLARHGVTVKICVSDNDVYGDDGRPAFGYLSCSLDLVVQTAQTAMVTCKELSLEEIVDGGVSEIDGHRWGSEEIPATAEQLPDELVITIETNDGVKKVVCRDLPVQFRAFGYEERNYKFGVLELTPA